MNLMVISHTYMTAMSQEKVQALAAYVSKLTVLTPTEFKDTLRTVNLESIQNPRFELIGLQSIFGKHHSLRLYNPWQLARIFEEVKPDIVCIEQEPYSLSTFQIMRLKKRFGFKVACLSSQNIFKTYPIPFSWTERYCVKNIDLFIGVSSSVLPIWVEKGIPKDRTIALPQVGVSLDQFKADNYETSRKRFKVGKFAYAYAGRFVEEKGIQVFLQAFSQFRYQDQCEILLIGGGPYRAELDRQIQRLRIQDKVRYIEGIKHHEMPQILNAIDVLVLPSLTRPHWKEQFGHIIIEALACGKPVLGSDTMPIPETMGQGGIAFEEGNASKLAAAMNLIFEDKNLYRTLSERGLAHVRAHYTNEVISQKLVEALGKL